MPRPGRADLRQTRQLRGRDAFVGGIAGAEIREENAFAWRVLVEPAAKRRQILAPIERAIDEVTPAVRRAADDLIEVSEIVRAHGDRFSDVPQCECTDERDAECATR